MSVELLLQKQRDFFKTGKTLDIPFRIQMLKKLYEAIKKYENEIANALKADLGKSKHEGYMCEIGLTLSEISYMMKHIKYFARDKRVPTPIAQFCSRSYIKSVPFGNVLIMSPWNYPFLLTVEPLANAISAGNTVILKPSAYSSETSSLIQKIISEIFDESYVAVITGGREENTRLLSQKFDFIFFTGSQNVGKEVLRRCAENLTPSVLELGGKSPCIVEKSADIPISARRIVFGKYLNCGQTCVAPDYILCQSSVKEEFIKHVKSEIKAQLGDNPLENPHYGKIISQKHFDRICGLIDSEKVIVGGIYNREALKIAPTVMDNVTFEDKVMQEEIFGPLMPIISYENNEDLFEIFANRQKPLALYLFTENKKLIKEITSRVPYGGGCINDTIIHLSSPHLPFGGVGESGMGAYHGKTGFDTFSHQKSILHKKIRPDINLRYRPYSERDMSMMRKFLK